MKIFIHLDFKTNNMKKLAFLLLVYCTFTGCSIEGIGPDRPSDILTIGSFANHVNASFIQISTNITELKEYEMIRYGLVYSTTNGEPTVDDELLSFTEGYSLEMLLLLEDLSQETTYYIKSFVETEVGIAYSNAVDVTTTKLEPPCEIPGINRITWNNLNFEGSASDNAPEEDMGYVIYTHSTSTGQNLYMTLQFRNEPRTGTYTTNRDIFFGFNDSHCYAKGWFGTTFSQTNMEAANFQTLYITNNGNDTFSIDFCEFEINSTINWEMIIDGNWTIN